MQAIYDRHGAVIGWLDEYLLLDAAGRCCAFIAKRLVFNQRGRHIGFLEEALVRDRIGEVVAFLAGAEGGLDLPACQTAGQPPSLTLPQSLPKFQESAISRHLFETPACWSALDWTAFLNS